MLGAVLCGKCAFWSMSYQLCTPRRYHFPDLYVARIYQLWDEPHYIRLFNEGLPQSIYENFTVLLSTTHPAILHKDTKEELGQ